MPDEENPWDPRKRRRRFFDEFSFDFEDEFREIEEGINEFFNELSKIPFEEGNVGPFIYGFSVRSGADGEPILNEFGNIPVKIREAHISDKKEPLIDMIDGNEEVTVVAELSGVRKEDIKLDVGEETLTIDVDTESGRYHKALVLPCAVQTESAKASYKNGVLEVKLMRREGRKKGKTINIE
ncbi:MAG: Hsp20/alpha crystallin family protein [Candidatus Altiarchaeales archaeon]|nr:Hsp20/alpha crystallin family protein [Candidatus Altiarchaeales archaeon]